MTAGQGGRSVRFGIATSQPKGDERTDRELVTAVQGGDAAALETLLRRHYDNVHALCRRILCNDDDALDATQEALIAIAKGVARFDGRSAFSTWIYRVSTNAALDEVRRRRRRPASDLGGYESAAEALETGSPRGGSGQGGADDPASSVAARIDVDRALSSLSADHRAAVVLRDLLDLDYAEIADALEIPIGTVRSRIARGRAAVAECLRDGGNTAVRAEGTRGTRGDVQSSAGVASVADQTAE